VVGVGFPGSISLGNVDLSIAVGRDAACFYCFAHGVFSHTPMAGVSTDGNPHKSSLFLIYSTLLHAKLKRS
jgi:hypothetical protein